jgi:hypothetical protein
MKTTLRSFAMLFPVLSLFVLAGIAVAQNMQDSDLCHDVLKLAFYDHAFSLETSKSTVAWETWACSVTESQAQRAFSLGLDIPIPESNLIVGGSANESSASSGSRNTATTTS